MKRLLLCLIPFLLISCAPPAPIKIGFIAGVSGRMADLGGTGRNGALLAVEMRNQAGGIHGRKVELLVRDDEQDAEKGRAAVRDLAAQEVVGIVGPMTSSVGAAIAPTLDELKLIAIAGTVTTTSLTGKDDHFFRVIASTRVYARHNATESLRRFGSKPATLVIDLANRDYTESWMEDFKAAYEAGGGKILQVIRFDSRQPRNYQELASKALAGNPGLIGLVCSATDAGLLVQKLRQMAPGIALTGGGWTASERLLELGGKAVEGMLAEQYFNRNDNSEAYKKFYQTFLARFGNEPGFAGVAGFDAANVMMDALAKDPKRENLKQTLLAIRAFKGLQDEIRFDDFGDADRRLYLTEVRDGRFVPLAGQ